VKLKGGKHREFDQRSELKYEREHLDIMKSKRILDYSTFTKDYSNLTQFTLNIGHTVQIHGVLFYTVQ
jgi:hypothetical protein